MPHEPRLRDYLTRDEVAALLRSSKKSRHSARNYAMILIAYRHGLRASELVNLRMSDLDLRTGTIYCRRAKGSRSSLHPMKRDEVAALEKVLRDRGLRATDHVFQSERAERMSRSAFWLHSSDSMVDRVTKVQRSAMMAAVRGTDTTQEIYVRKVLFAAGHRSGCTPRICRVDRI